MTQAKRDQTTHGQLVLDKVVVTGLSADALARSGIVLLTTQAPEERQIASLASNGRSADGRSLRREYEPSTAVLAPADCCTVEVASSVTGYSIKAIRRKIEEGIWREKREYWRAPDGRILIDLKGYLRWARGDAAEAA